MGSRDASNVLQTTMLHLAPMCEQWHPHIQMTAGKLGMGLRQFVEIPKLLISLCG